MGDARGSRRCSRRDGRERVRGGGVGAPERLIDRSNPLFLELGVNGRTCASCHDGRAGWTITPTFARQLFNASDGLAPLFRIHETNPAILANVIKIGSGLCGARLRHPIGGISLVNTAFVA